MLDDDVRARFEEALIAFRAAGMRISEIVIPHTETIANVYIHISLKEAAAFHAATLNAVPERYTPPVRQRLEMDAVSNRKTTYACARRARAARHDVDEALDGCDALVPHAADPRTEDRSRDGAGRTCLAAAAQHDAPPHPALQHHGAPRDLHPLRPHE
jgi:Asp-tRNA(Asn)/Glu-tRNA(Gln) amidotransferase A subunit family amidase